MPGILCQILDISSINASIAFMFTLSGFDEEQNAENFQILLKCVFPIEIT